MDEFQSNRFLPVHEDPLLFVTPQWGRKDRCLWFVIYKTCAAILIPIWVVMDFVTEYEDFYPDKPGIWFIFATNWGFILLAVSAVTHGIIIIQYFCQKSSNNKTDYMPISYSVFWVVHNISANSALVISISFWTFMAVLVTDDYMSSEMSELKHSLSSIYVMIDLLISATPIRLLHFIYPAFFGTIYTLFNAVYFLNDGKGPDGHPYTYYVLYWKKPMEAVTTSFLETILCILMQVLLFSIYKMRVLIYNKVYNASCCAAEENTLFQQSPSNTDESNNTKYKSIQG